MGVLTVASVGIGILLYPSAARWFAARAHDEQVTGYVEEVRQLPLPQKQAALTSAREYNQSLPGVPLGDPYRFPPGMDRTAAGVATYLDQLGLTPVLGRVRIPVIGVDLPIYHGTSEQTLSLGVGHLFGSSLPVGGEGTHAVLTGHSGLVDATMFDGLHDLKIGDRFTIVVLDEVLTYQVDQILTVEPSDTEPLRPTPGKDYVTLVTCTPIGVNSHRLLVRGIRVPTTAKDASTTTVPGTGQSAGFPWWALGMLAAPSAAAVGMRAPKATRHRTDRRRTVRRRTRRGPRRPVRHGRRHAVRRVPRAARRTVGTTRRRRRG
ncbi:class C sortase [Xylanimonas allomyrinae]|uniref:class C sortase n=1 Tax=Xylanimonas allomyrinae TaxID=2509459 RepID=UPI0013A6400F|nr:class C sortase [Xylanimonas allomyrinae]